MQEAPSLLDGPPPADGALTVLSVCSSVGGKDLGFHRAGFRTIGLCEFDPWRRKVLDRHWPGVPVHEDLEALADWCEEDPAAVIDWLGGRPPDVLIGGTPCQDLSNAGKRAGLDGERSGLFWAFCRVRNALAPRWTCWENVAGALSSNDGLDFASVLGAFVGADVAVPLVDADGRPDGRRGWPGAGVASGPWGGCCWRLLNAQHFGVPQRRRRIFVVGRLGAACPPEVLIDAHGLRGDPATGAEARQVAPWAPDHRAGGHGGRSRAPLGRGALGGARAGGRPDGDGVVGALDCARGGADDNDATQGHVVPDVAGTLGGRTRFDGPESDGAYVAPSLSKVTGARTGHSGADEAALAVARAAGADGLSLRPEDRDDGQPPAGRAGADDDEGRDPGDRAGAVGAAEADADGVRAPDGLAGRVHDPARAEEGQEGCEEEGLRTFSKLHSAQSADDAETWHETDVARTITEHDASRQDSAPALVASPVPTAKGELMPETAGAVTAHYAKGQTSTLEDGQVIGVRDDEQAHALTSEGHDGSEDGMGRGAPIVAGALLGKQGKDGGGFGADQAAAGHVVGGAKVLDTYNQNEVEGGVTNTLAKTPTTALMGAPSEEDWVDDPNPPPDGRRYAACGDGVVAPVAHWIGLRIAECDAGVDPDTGREFPGG